MRLWRGLFILFFALGVGCGDDEDEALEGEREEEEEVILYAIPGSSIRVGEYQAEESDAPYYIRIFTEEEDCRAAQIPSEDYAACLPYVDRSSGEVHLGFRFEREGFGGDGYLMHDISERLEVFHQGTGVADGLHDRRVEVIPHEAEKARNIYVLLIDGSSSMSTIKDRKGRSRLHKVKEALVEEDVIDTFYPPGGGQGGVVLLQFAKRDSQDLVTSVGGGSMRILQTRAEYKEAVARMKNRGGFTPLYDAIEETLMTHLDGDFIKESLTEDSAVTLIALSDGFNNVEARDQCRDNAPRLQKLLKSIYLGKFSETTNLWPRIYTVGLGQAVFPDFAAPDWDALDDKYRLQISGDEDDGDIEELRVKGRSGLCRTYATERIDGKLENRGIDSASLAWIAGVGGGESFVSNSKRGLADAFRRAASVRYSWFEVRYDHDPFYLRRQFKTSLQLNGQYSTRSSLMITPSSWMDGPPGESGDDGWTRPRGFIHSLLIFVPLLSMCLLLSYWGVVSLNMRRGIMGMLRRGRARVKDAAVISAVGPPPPARPPPPPPSS